MPVNFHHKSGAPALVEIPLSSDLLSNAALIKALTVHQSKLAPKDQDFAGSLIVQYQTKGHLSDKQWYWVKTLITKATEPKPPVEAVTVGDFAGVLALFAKAKQHLQAPKIELDLKGQPVVMAIAGNKSKHPGSIVLSNGEAYGTPNRVFFGLVKESGAFLPNPKLSQGDIAELTAFLGKLAADPAGVAAQFGKTTGKCCFCAHKLTDAKSLAVGYGPTCASHFGLPWGKPGTYQG